MKIRCGFISNSSSSSFILITTKENHEKTLEKLDNYAKAVINSIASESKVFGKNLVYITTFSGMGGEGTFDNIDIDFNGEKPELYEEEGNYLAFEKYQDEIIKDKGNVFTTSIDF